MDSQNSRKIIVAGGMAAVVVATVIAVRAHHDTLAAGPPVPPTPFTDVPATPATVAQTPDVPDTVPPIENVGPTSADTATPSAVEPKLARERHPAKADRSAAATADSSEKPAAVANSSPADDQKVGTNLELAASDSQITTDVKSELASDSLSKDANIGVTTTRGVVALTGTLVSQSAIDHVKDVAGKAKDVKSVDASALILASL
jgi:hypothetical protein